MAELNEQEEAKHQDPPEVGNFSGMINTRDFVLVDEGTAGRPAKLETFRLADSGDDSHNKLARRSALPITSNL